MKSIIKKIKKRIKLTKDAYKNDVMFSRKLANYRMIDEICQCLRLKKISSIYHNKKDEFIIKYLKDEMLPVIDIMKNCQEIGVSGENAPIWICWWNGIESAPALVKQCIMSIQKNSGHHIVYIITKENYKEYLNIPDFIIDKLNSGIMCIANFTDYLRVSLLEKYGGLWLDATIYCSQLLPEEYFKIPFFTCKSDYVQDSRYISKYRWTSFCMGGWKNNIIFQYMKAAFELYWEKEKGAIDYLLVDYLIDNAYRNNTLIRLLIENVPITNTARDELQTAMNDARKACDWKEVIRNDTVIYKLSWRETYLEVNSDGSDTIYKYFLDK